jgi:hypothetical protein
MVRPSLISKKIIKNHSLKLGKINNVNNYIKTNIIVLMIITMFLMYLYIKYLDKQKNTKSFQY